MWYIDDFVRVNIYMEETDIYFITKADLRQALVLSEYAKISDIGTQLYLIVKYRGIYLGIPTLNGDLHILQDGDVLFSPCEELKKIVEESLQETFESLVFMRYNQ